jgi:hypothetical protein
LPLLTIALARTKTIMFSRFSVLGSLRKDYFQRTLLSFLSRGTPTKNPCDHLFNAHKRFYRAQNIETFEDLICILNQSGDVVATEVTPDDFHDWTTMFQGLYSNLPKVLKYHLLESTDIEFVSMRVGDGHAEEVANLKFPKEEDDQLCAEQLETLLPSILNPPGLKEIKMVELFTKFHKFLKPINMDKTCPYPGDEVMARIKKSKTVNRNSKKRKQAPSETTDKNNN